jgi:hypothetical protein
MRYQGFDGSTPSARQAAAGRRVLALEHPPQNVDERARLVALH